MLYIIITVFSAAVASMDSRFTNCDSGPGSEEVILDMLFDYVTYSAEKQQTCMWKFCLPNQDQNFVLILTLLSFDENHSRNYLTLPDGKISV